MARRKLLPPIETLLAWRDEGLSQAQIAARVNERNALALGSDFVAVSRSAVSLAFQRAGATGDGRARYSEHIPWSPIRPEHKNQYPHSMLRLWARESLGEALTPAQAARLESFRRQLNAVAEVITYDPGNGGFIPVAKRPGIDEGLIRVP